jgi:hypothetical protein
MNVRTFVGVSTTDEDEAAVEASVACNEFFRENFITRNRLAKFKVNTSSHTDHTGRIVRFSYTITVVIADL